MNTRQARGYIASGKFRENRVPQHIQNQTIRIYCEENGLHYVLSRAEYAISKNNTCQLLAALHEGYQNIVAYSIMQLPENTKDREKIYKITFERGIMLHFACERITAKTKIDFNDIEAILMVQTLVDQVQKNNSYLETLKSYLEEKTNDNGKIDANQN